MLICWRQLTLGALNSSRTAYAAFSLDPKTFFTSYKFGNPGGRFTCQMYNKVSPAHVLVVHSLMIVRLFSPSSKGARPMLETQRRASSVAMSALRTCQIKSSAAWL